MADSLVSLCPNRLLVLLVSTSPLCSSLAHAHPAAHRPTRHEPERIHSHPHLKQLRSGTLSTWLGLLLRGVQWRRESRGEDKQEDEDDHLSERHAGFEDHDAYPALLESLQSFHARSDQRAACLLLSTLEIVHVGLRRAERGRLGRHVDG